MRAHPSELTWTRMLDGALSPFQRLRLALHLRGCEKCRAQRQGLLSEQAAFQTAPERAGEMARLVSRFGGRASPPRFLGSLAWAAAGLAAAGAAVLLVWSRGDAGDDELRPKGAALFEVISNRGSEVAPLRQRCRPGDALRARIRTDHAYVLIVGIDPEAKVTALYPMGGERSAEASGGEVLTPGSWVLDAAPGQERFVALFSDRSLPLEEVRRAIEAAPAEAVVVPGARSVERSCFKEAP